MHILVRLEPGCLGPEGIKYVEEFCTYAKPKLKELYANILHWVIKPRYDKSLPEVEYQIQKATIKQEQAKAFLGAFSIDISDFEDELDERLADLVEEFFERE